MLTVVTTLFLRYTGLGTAYRAIADDREITATLGVPVRRVEASAWLGSGLVCGAAGLLLADLYTSLDYSALTFLVISSLAAALIGRLRSLWITLAGGLTVGVVQGVLTPYTNVSAVPVGHAVRALHHRAALARTPARRRLLPDHALVGWTPHSRATIRRAPRAGPPSTAPPSFAGW